MKRVRFNYAEILWTVNLEDKIAKSSMAFTDSGYIFDAFVGDLITGLYVEHKLAIERC